MNCVTHCAIWSIVFYLVSSPDVTLGIYILCYLFLFVCLVCCMTVYLFRTGMFLNVFPEKQRQLHINSYDILRNMPREAMQVSKELKCRAILMQSEPQNFNFSMNKKRGLVCKPSWMAVLGRYRSLETAKSQPLKQGKGMEQLNPALAHVLPTPCSEQITWV